MWWILGIIGYLIMGYATFCANEAGSAECGKSVGWDDVAFCMGLWWLIVIVLPFYDAFKGMEKLCKDYKPERMSIYRWYRLRKERRNNLYKPMQP